MSGTAARRRGLAGLILPVLLLATWEAGADTGLLPDYLIAPSRIVIAFTAMAISGELWVHVGASLYRAYMGFAIGSALGIVLGLWAGTSRGARGFFNPLMSAIYPVPKVAFLPILIIWLGLGDPSKIATIALSVFFPAFINAYAGTRAVPNIYLWAGRAMGASSLRMFFLVMLPASLPHVLAGVRVGLGLAFVVLFAAELFGARSGLGYLIGVAEDSRRYDLMYVAIIAIGLFGFLSDRALIVVRRRLLAGQTLSKEEVLA